MTHLHKLEKWRHNATKERVVIGPVFGSSGFSVLFFEYRRRYARNEKLFASRHDAREWLKSNGFNLEA